MKKIDISRVTRRLFLLYMNKKWLFLQKNLHFQNNRAMRSLVPFVLLLLASVGFCRLQAQEEGWRDYLEQLAEEEGADAATIENMYEELLQWESRPMELNSVTKDELERFPLLSAEEVSAIATFLTQNRPLVTPYELRNVPGLEFNTVQRILPFFRVEEARQQESIRGIPDMLRRGMNEFQFRFDKTITPRAGYGTFPDSILEKYPNRKYRGEDFYTSLKYAFRYRDRIQAGFTAEKDAGEPFFRPGYPKGYDFYGAHLILTHFGKLKSAAIGDYRLSFGQGLVLNNDFMVSKAWSIDRIVHRTQQPKRHFSTAESNFFRGAAVLVTFGDFSFTAFYSNKRIDANLSPEGDITSFKTDGLHRTPSEIAKKRNVREQVTGGNINFRKENIQIGVSGIYYVYDKQLNPIPRKYNLYALRHSSHLNAGIDYSWQLPGFIFAGETAMAANGALATLNMLQYRPSSELSLTLLHRFYPISYNALHAQAFSEGGATQNERGLFAGSTFNPFGGLTVSAYIDFVRFPWLKYGIDTPSKATDFYLSGSYPLSSRSTLEAYYKYKRKEKNASYPDEKSTSVLPYTTHKARLRYSLQSGSGWNFRTIAGFARYTLRHAPTENGFMLSQNIGYHGKKTLTGDAFVAYFNADSYATRLYSYERNLLNSFYLPSFYGRGIRVALSAKYEITSHLYIAVKAGRTRYFDRDTIGSGTELICGNSRTDLFIYLRWRF